MFKAVKCLSAIFFFTLLSSFFFTLSPLNAQSASCTIGPKIAGNINVDNYATIMSQYSHCDQVYVTIIYTGGDLSDAHYQDTLNNIKTAKSLGIIPIVRTWGQMFGEEAATAARNLNRLVEEAGSFRVYYGNELNLSWEGCDANPSKCAQSFNDFLKGINYAPKFQLSLPPVAGHQNGAEFQFLDSFLNQKLSNGQTVAQFYQSKGNGMFATIYGGNVQEILQQIDATNQALSKYGLKVTGISEIGPFVNGGLLQGVDQMNQWIQVMTPIFQYFAKNPQALTDRGIDFLNTSFFADLDGDGFPDVTLLVVIDENGNVQILQEALKLDGGFGWDMLRNTTCSINGEIPESNKYPFRPSPCKNCRLAVPKPALTCAQSPVVVQYQNFTCRDVHGCPEDPNKFIVNFDWAPVNFDLNTKGVAPDSSEGTKVPFVGYKDVCRSTAEARGTDPKACDTTGVSVRSTNANDYLNDYFEGTALFDQRFFDMNNPADVRDLWWEYGIYRKITPLEAQDKKRIELIKRGFNYEIKGKIKDINGNVVERSHKLQEWAQDMQPYNKEHVGNKGRLPPVVDLSSCTNQATYDECRQRQTLLYQDNYIEWLQQDWGGLWYHIPFFSREDAPGKVILTIEHEPGTINAGGNSYREEIPLSIPHLTRLYESTSELYRLLTPTMEKELGNTAYTPSDNELESVSYIPITTPRLLAQAAISDSYEPTLLAQAQSQSCTGMKLIVENKGDHYGIHGFNTMPAVCGDPSDGMAHVEYLVDGNPIGGCTVHLGNSLYLPREDPNSSNPHDKYGMSIGDLGGCAPPSPSQVGSRNLTVRFWMENSHASDDAAQGCTKTPSCNCRVGDPNCTAQAQPTPPPPPCSNGSGIDPTCSGTNPQIDPQPNDEICCSSKAQVNVKGYTFSASQTSYTDDDDMRPCSCRNLLPGEEPPRDGIGNINWAALCGSNTKTYTARMSRQVEVKLDVPYLKDVWGKTSGPGLAIFNLFKPKEVGDYEDADALSNLTYEVTSDKLSYLSFTGIDDSLINQQSLRGDLYLPYLGGIHQAKKCVSEQILTPDFLKTGENWCKYKVKLE